MRGAILGDPPAMSVIAGGAVAGLLIANNIGRTTRGIEKAKETWPALGERGLTVAVEETSGFAVATGKDRPKAHGALGGHPVVVQILTDFVHCARTEIVVQRAGADAKVGVYPSPGGVLGQLRDWLQNDIEIGDEGFDAAFLVTGKPAEAAKSVLSSAALRERIAGLAGGSFAGIELDAERVRVTLSGVETDPATLGAALDLALAAAG